MPEVAVQTQKIVEASRQQTPVLQESETPSLSRPFPVYKASDDVIQTSAPDPIKVTSKKKGTGKKKKRTQNSTIDVL
jgi:AP-3 complex subunit delta